MKQLHTSLKDPIPSVLQIRGTHKNIQAKSFKHEMWVGIKYFCMNFTLPKFACKIIDYCKSISIHEWSFLKAWTPQTPLQNKSRSFHFSLISVLLPGYLLPGYNLSRLTVV